MQVGEDAGSPRVISSLPFNDSGNTATGGFRHDYTTSPNNPLVRAEQGELVAVLPPV